MRAYLGLAGLTLLTACGIPSNPEKGPMVLHCEGEEVNRAANGEVVRERQRAFYQLDGVAHTLSIWDDKTQSFGIGRSGLTVTGTEARYGGEYSILAGVGSIRTITFDRVSGRVTDEFAMDNGGTITFTALCKPVKDPTSETKF